MATMGRLLCLVISRGNNGRVPSEVVFCKIPSVSCYKKTTVITLLPNVGRQKFKVAPLDM
jgi:hypothetical protein